MTGSDSDYDSDGGNEGDIPNLENQIKLRVKLCRGEGLFFTLGSGNGEIRQIVFKDERCMVVGGCCGGFQIDDMSRPVSQKT